MNAVEKPAGRGDGKSDRVLCFDQLLVGDEWRHDAWVAIGASGNISSLGWPETGQTIPRGASVQRVAGWTVPGVPNVHSHAFQRAMAGMAEYGGAGSFWTWRHVMYAFAGVLSPSEIEAIAAQLYVELLKGGFTSAGEFHYLHHAPSGRAYDDPAETSRRILRAANAAGIRLVHMPVVYEVGGLDGRELAGTQQRFRLDLDGALRLREALAADFRRSGHTLGWAVHSLRAVPRETVARFAEIVEGTKRARAEPVHIHVAEQEREVDDCKAALGARPVEWLLANAPVDERWCLVHSTHVMEEEAKAVANAGAVAGVCPVTEANLGDGIFLLGPFTAAGGRFAIGTDSHVSRSAAEELRLLEYGQRLTRRTRRVLGSGDSTAPAGAMSGAGGLLLKHAWRDGSQALALAGGKIAAGCRADFVVLDGEHPALVGRDGHDVLDSWVFSGSDNPVAQVFVGGVQVVKDGRHDREDEIANAYRRSVAEIVQRL